MMFKKCSQAERMKIEQGNIFHSQLLLFANSDKTIASTCKSCQGNGDKFLDSQRVITAEQPFHSLLIPLVGLHQTTASHLQGFASYLPKNKNQVYLDLPEFLSFPKHSLKYQAHTHPTPANKLSLIQKLYVWPKHLAFPETLDCLFKQLAVALSKSVKIETLSGCETQIPS